MKRLGLIGKEIQHSRSPTLYDDLLEIDFQYDLLDYPSGDEIPGPDELMRIYDGLNITAPFKKHFLGSVENIGSYSCLNVIRKFEGSIQGTSTDYPALEEILKGLINGGKIEKIILLGDGAMAELLIDIFEQNQLIFKQYSRKRDGALEAIPFMDSQLLIINACSRSFTFSGRIHSDNIFWDLNYKHNKHGELLPSLVQYVDGSGLLKKQAELALEFWNF